ncbi:hypothetical protein GLOIN_2v1770605 [Rhizophagus irregularis DAOM 181602=DAOM 197198]|uniref:Uncharacterized protein n=2 Tax=Rhizophagus irregularis TaxID=588596 RepID=A0A2H5UGB2_RHIID|nr:hypothetical protein GLOIN_2v1770605 [Rhizophagus irregularis DAOM 181602=DAOM 197198]POG75004.1 hypothetical protein GLOIN_2v1770605 [Rhizophagus irregularis DAOM 181602=DAOM 197198]|eukprot:XP_025181870.1 hypothetical protein GLOIN_2v1770605 [Rhizophagus irregularis DAOM 181602=DAOM 197198]
MSVEKNIEENIQLISNNVFESKFGVFKILDYDLNLDERKMKFKKYDHVICEDCNREIEKFNFTCYNCYNKETDRNEQNRMNFGICKFCFKSNNSYICSACKIFETSDYDLNYVGKKAKYEDYDYIFCEKCNKEIDKQNYYCTDCYSKETNINKKSGMKYGLKYGIFSTLDYNLNLEERKAKYKDFDRILCDKCNNRIKKLNYYCSYCYNKETNIIRKDLMKYGSNFGIFRTSDYNLSLKERRVKYKDYDCILCEKCKKETDNNDYYCINCYIGETDIIKKGFVKYGSNFKIFSTLDYNLNLEERRAKYKEFDGILCEKCNNEVSKQHLYCTYCYNNKETDINKKCFMKCGPNFRIFSTLDYHLNLEERKAKYKEYDHILCEKCIKEIDRQCYYNCQHCYNNQMINDKCKVCFIGKINNCCSFYEFQQFLEDFNKWIIENKFIDDYLIKEQKGETSDYDLFEDDRRVKYKDCDYIICEKCNNKYHYNYCYKCFDKEIRELKELSSKLKGYKYFYSKIYNKETKELRKLKELQLILKDYNNVYFKLNGNLGIFKQIIQQFETTKYYIDNKKILINNIRYNGINNCWRKLRSYCDCYDKEIDINEKRRMEFGRCKECFKIHEDLDGCLSCNSKCFQRDFDKWTSGNGIIDKLIRENQLSVRRQGLLEWVPYDKFTNVNYIAKGGFAKVYSAIWLDGQIRKWSQLSNSWKRNGSTTIALKVLNNSENISEDFLNEIKFFNEVSGYMCIIKCFGITQDPITNNYTLVLQLG